MLPLLVSRWIVCQHAMAFSLPSRGVTIGIGGTSVQAALRYSELRASYSEQDDRGAFYVLFYLPP